MSCSPPFPPIVRAQCPMHSTVAESLYERLLSSYPSGQSYKQADWDRGPMPGPIRHFLVHLLRHQSRHESQRLRRAGSEWVGYDAQEVQSALSRLQDVLSRHARIPEGEWEGALQQATRYVTAYLFRPAPVLSDFVFGKQAASLPLERIRWRMQFFRPYPYLANAVNAYAERQNVSSFERDTFRRFLHQIDRRLTADYSHDQWMDALQPLLDLTQAATGTAEVPIQELRPFFQDKGHTVAVQRLDRLSEDGQSRIGASGLHRVLKPERTTEERAPEAEPLRSSDAPWSSSDPASGEDSDPALRGASDESDGPTPLWKRFQAGSSPSSGNGSAREGASPKGAGKPLWAQYRSSRQKPTRRPSSELPDSELPGPELSSPFSSEASDAPLQPISSSSMPEGEAPSKSPFDTGTFDDVNDPAPGTPTSSDKASIEALERKVLGGSNPPQRGVFVRQLFGGDLGSYHDVLDKLQHADSWSQASQIIARDIFRAHKVNIYSDAAVHFTNAVEQRFRTQ